MVDEIGDLREDMARQESSERLVRMEKDIRTIKLKLSNKDHPNWY